MARGVSRTAPAKVPAPANPAGNRGKATNSQKAKIKNPSNTRAPSAHPTYLEMIGEAVTSLKERTGSSQYAITKFIEDKHKSNLPSNFSKVLLVQLRKFVASGKLTKVKNSYKIPQKTKKPSVTEPTKTKKTKSVKATAVAKPKAVVKVSKPKPKTVAVKSNNRSAKVAKTSAKQTPGKKVAVSKKTVAAPKKVVKTTKKVKSGNSAVKVPVRKALARKA